MNKEARKIVAGLNYLIGYVGEHLHPQYHPFIQLLITGITPELQEKICDPDWKTIQLSDESDVGKNLMKGSLWSGVAMKMLETRKCDIWIDRIWVGNVFTGSIWRSTLVIVPTRK